MLDAKLAAPLTDQITVLPLCEIQDLARKWQLDANWPYLQCNIRKLHNMAFTNCLRIWENDNSIDALCPAERIEDDYEDEGNLGRSPWIGWIGERKAT